MHKRPRKAESVTPDEILESLTKQAGSQQDLGEAQTKRLELLAESEETREVFEPDTSLPISTETRKSLGHFAFILMFLGGLIAVWVFTRGGRLFDPSVLTSVVQATGVQRVFANTLEVGVIFFTASIIALWVAHRRRNSSLNILDR